MKPNRQRRGLGSHLVDFLDRYHGLGNELVFVQTLASSEAFWKKLGWEIVDSTDIDLSDWQGEGRGYGLHRSPQMLRYPAPAK